jgi:hypothetical protein
MVRTTTPGARGWSRQFEEPIPLKGRQLIALRDAGDYITKLPKSEPAEVLRRFGGIG